MVVPCPSWLHPGLHNAASDMHALRLLVSTGYFSPVWPSAGAWSGSVPDPTLLDSPNPLKSVRASEKPPLLNFLSWPLAVLSANSAQLSTSLQQPCLVRQSQAEALYGGLTICQSTALASEELAATC